MIVTLLGSGADDSLSRRGLAAFAAQAHARGLGFDLIDLRHEFRELHAPCDYAAPPAGSQTARLRARVAAANAVILATPVYHGSFSGLLKNALDHLQPGAFRHRAVGLVTAAGVPRTGLAAGDALRAVVRALGGWSAPTQVAITAEDFASDGISPLLRERIGGLLDDLDWLAAGTRRPAATEADR